MIKQKIPYILVNNDSIYDIINSDSSEKLYIKYQLFYPFYIYKDKKLYPDNNFIEKSILQSFSDIKNGIITYNTATNDIKNIINNLYDKINENISMQEKVLYSAMLNYFLSLYSFDKSIIQCDIDFCFSEGTFYKQFQLFESAILSQINDDGVLYTNKNNETIIYHKPTYKNIYKRDVFTAIEEFKENNPLYYAIQIYGVGAYIILNDFISKTINTQNLYCSTQKELLTILPLYI